MDAAERHRTFEACFNFRDLGGYGTLDGRQVRWGCVYRSDALHRLSPNDIEEASGLGLRTVIDLRTTSELDRDGRFAGANDVTFWHLPVFEDDALPFKRVELGDPEPPPGEAYLAMAAAGTATIATALRAIAEGDHAVVFHCAAGKDRTGILAALLLAVLGVPDDVIAADYTLSDRSIEPALAWARNNEPEWAAWLAAVPDWLLRAPETAMLAFLDLIRQQYGSINSYLAHAHVELEVIEALRCRLLE